MKMLIAEDEPVSCRMLEGMLSSWNHEVIVARNGEEAWKILQEEGAPSLAILDWMMPGIDGLEVVRRTRRLSPARPAYLILLTARGRREDVVEGLLAEADDYITKPFDREELRARIQVGARMVQLQLSLADRVRELEAALSNVRRLRGLLPICSYCKKVRRDSNYWQQIERYIADHSEAEFTHGICPECYEKALAPQLEEASEYRAADVGFTRLGRAGVLPAGGEVEKTAGTAVLLDAEVAITGSN